MEPIGLSVVPDLDPFARPNPFSNIGKMPGLDDGGRVRSQTTLLKTIFHQ